MKVIAHTPAQMLRILKMRGGIIAISGRNTWLAMKATNKADITVNIAIMRALFHWKVLMLLDMRRKIKQGRELTAYVEPPH